MDLFSVISKGIADAPLLLAGQFLSPQATYSVFSLLGAFLILGAWIVVRRARRGKITSFGSLLKAIFPMRIVKSASHLVDVKWLLFNTCAFSLMFGMFLVSDQFIAGWMQKILVGAFGARQPTELSPAFVAAFATIVIFLALELGYYIDHYLKHRIEFLWEFHKLHHSAEVLTPFTNSRVHPVDSLIYGNILAVASGTAGGLIAYEFGETAVAFKLFNLNAFIFLFNYTFNHLYHTHAPIAFTGLVGRLLTSPVHHQLHHSTDPRHFNRNLGGSLMIYDWLFGTLLMPSKEHRNLRFGVEGEGDRFDGFAKGFVNPIRASLSGMSRKFATPSWIVRRSAVPPVRVRSRR